MHVKTGISFAALGMLAISPALAQVTPTPAAGSKHVIPEKQGEPLQSGRSESDESLSKKLSKSDGVIAPKENVDPGMKAPAPDPTPHTTPVIPPSATPGGKEAK